MTKITICKEHLQILARVAGAAATESSRPSLACVRIEPGLIVATDGRVLRTEAFEGHDVTGLITLYAIKVAQIAKGSNFVDIEVIDGDYPSWRNIVPDATYETDGVHPWILGNVLTQFLKTLSPREVLQFRATRSPTSAVRVYSLRLDQPVFVGVVMPVHVKVSGP